MITTIILAVMAISIGTGFEARADDYIGVPLTQADPKFSFDDKHYLSPITFDFATRNKPGECADATDVLVTGITRLTGKVFCVKKNITECPAGTVAEKLVAKYSAATNSTHLEYNCRALQSAGCPTDYIWQSLNLASLDPGPAPVSAAYRAGAGGTCVYKWRNNIAWQIPWPSGQESVSNTFCNPVVYSAVGNGGCSANVTSSSNGTCWDPCNCVTDPVTGATSCDSCPRTFVPSAYTSYSTSGASASCSIQYSNACGSSISGYVSWSGTCQIKKPQTAAPL